MFSKYFPKQLAINMISGCLQVALKLFIFQKFPFSSFFLSLLFLSLCFVTFQSNENHVLGDIVIQNEKEQPPTGYMLIEHTVDTGKLRFAITCCWLNV